MNLSRDDNRIIIGDCIVHETDTIDFLHLGKSARIYDGDIYVGNLVLENNEFKLDFFYSGRVYEKTPFSWIRSMFLGTNRSHPSVISIPEAN